MAVVERWRVVEGYDGHYWVSDLGRITSLKGTRSIILAPGGPMGYPFVNLSKNGRQTPIKIHRLVAEAFIPNPLNLPTVNHKDGSKTNNAVSNLEWATYGENNTHAYYTGLKRQVKPVLALPIEPGVGFYFPSQSLAGRHGFNQSSISRVCRGTKKTHAGYTWVYMDIPVY